MPFNRPSPPQQIPPTPEQLFAALPRTGNGHATLWVHQGDILRSYFESFTDRQDVAIELPTGTGKTLPGLLIADWNRRMRTERVVFACPTVQLVHQVVGAAARQSIPVVDLSGSWREWDQSDRMRFEQAQAIGIVTYSTIFNSRPHIQDVGTIVFDDAHAGEQYVAGAYSLEVDRDKQPEIYEALRERLTPVLPPGVGQRLKDDATDPVAWNGVHLVLPGSHEGLAEGIEMDLAQMVEANSNLSFKLSMLRGHLDACLFYVSWRQILLRPFIPPTFENNVFFGARQRVYLSATLGDAGEIERAFGRQRVHRLPLPRSAGTPRSGRRFLVFPTLVRGANPTELSRKLIERAGRAIVLTPSSYGVAAAESRLVPLGWSVFKREHVESGFEVFASTQNAVSILANRYDGIDLPEDACRSVALFGHPRATHLQEEFLAVRARAVAAIGERIRARVIQGTGRCTRGPGDYALVIVADNDTATYLARPEIQRTFDPALQAEVQFGFANSEVTQDELLVNIDHFLRQDQEWHQEAEPYITQLQGGLSRVTSSGTAALGRSAEYEVHAAMLVWQGAWADALISANEAAQHLVGEDEVRAYRALWLLFSAYYANVAARRGLGISLDVSEAQAKAALAAAQPQTWIREVLPFPGLPVEPMPAHDLSAANAVAAYLLRGAFNAAHNIEQIQTMIADLGITDPARYEPALTFLGKMLGADAFKPSAQGNCDSAWCWDNHMWLTVEAKSDESAEAAISIDTVRQTNSHLAMLSAQRGNAAIPTPFAASIISSPRRAIDNGAVVAAQSHVHLVHVSELVSLAEDVQDLWSELRPLRNADANVVPQLVADVLRRRGLLPSDVSQRLTQRPVAAD